LPPRFSDAVTDHWPSEACLFERGSGPFADLSGELGSLRDEIFTGANWASWRRCGSLPST